MKTGNGKIANLPSEIRDELNYRISDGEEGIELVAWLNSKPEVAEVVKRLFDGTPISEQNLSEWRKRGYQKWLAHRNFIDESNALGDNTADIAETGIDCDKLLLTLTASYAEMIRNWIITPGEQMLYKLAVYKNLTNGVIALQRAELQKVRLEIARERLELLREKRRDKSASSSSSSAPDSSSSQRLPACQPKPANQSESGLPRSAPSPSDPRHVDPPPAEPAESDRPTVPAATPAPAQSDSYLHPAIPGGVIHASSYPPSAPVPQPAAPIRGRANPPGRVLSLHPLRIA